MKEELQLALRHSHLGLGMVLIVGATTYAGLKIGRWLHEETWGLVIGGLLGILGALAYLLFESRKLISNETDRETSPPGQ